jgi:DNA-binding response OmpR family regulator
MLVDQLTRDGREVVGVFARLEKILPALDDLEFDVALLDLNLAGTFSFPLADKLTARGIPYIVLTGYTDASFPPQYKFAPRLSKPCNATELHAKLKEVTRRA